ncbi:MAG TPA: adenosylmethionine decarboxylase, partial [Cytophagales bacterium]|nr:adenosylmethionine decarboxylase [Cytophagales bacterium]
ARLAGATIINSTFHHFAPAGISGVVVIQESHLALHTWPEYGYVALDVFTCGNTVDPWKACYHLKSALKAKESTSQEMKRGQVAQRQPTEIAPNTTSISPTREAWFTERRTHLALSLKHSGTRLFARQSAYQQIEVYDTSGYGSALVLDGAVVMTQADSAAYHEMLVHVAFQAASQPVRRALILGGGDGGAAREALRYRELESLVVVEQDPGIIDASRAAFPVQADSFQNPKVTLALADAGEFLENTEQEAFDLIFIDTYSEPVGYSANFLSLLHQCMAPKGLLVLQSGLPGLHPTEFAALVSSVKGAFPKRRVSPYLAYLPTFPSGMISFLLIDEPTGSNLPKEGTNLLAEDLYYYNQEVHQAAFALPSFLQKLL